MLAGIMIVANNKIKDCDNLLDFVIRMFHLIFSYSINNVDYITLSISQNMFK